MAIYWNATSAKLLSLRECSRSRSWDSSFSSARRPISSMLADALAVEIVGHARLI